MKHTLHGMAMLAALLPMANPGARAAPIPPPEPLNHFVAAGPGVYPWPVAPGLPRQPWVIMAAPVAVPPGYTGPPPMMMWFVPALMPHLSASPAMVHPPAAPAAASASPPTVPATTPAPSTPAPVAVQPAAPLRAEEMAPDLGASNPATPEAPPTQAAPPSAQAKTAPKATSPKTSPKAKKPLKKPRRLCWRNGDLIPCP